MRDALSLAKITHINIKHKQSMGAGPVTCKGLVNFRHQLYNGRLYKYPLHEAQEFVQQHNEPWLDMDPFLVLSRLDEQDLQERSPAREPPL